MNSFIQASFLTNAFVLQNLRLQLEAEGQAIKIDEDLELGKKALTIGCAACSMM